MPEYSILLSKPATKQLDKLSDDVAEVLFGCIQALATDPRPPGCKKLKGRDGYRIRQGDYRILYDIFDKTLVIEVVAIGHRKDIYG